jgi:ParB/RepB/Spo0J family partition protein
MKTTEVKTINLTEIDSNAITKANLREVTEDDKFDLLCEQINSEGQRNPIVVRELREEESTQPEAKYGILDGHHRYQALQSLNFETINAVIVESDNDTDDLIKAATYNLSQKNLEMWEIGKILVELNELTGKKIDVVAKGFGIARSTAFKYRKEYLKHLNPTDRPAKPAKILAEYDYETLTDYVQELNQEPNNALECQNHLDNIDYIKALLSDHKKKLKAQLTEFKKSSNKKSETTDNPKTKTTNAVKKSTIVSPWEDID